MLNKLFTKPVPALQLQVAEHSHDFADLPDFEFALAGRIAVPSGKIQRLVSCSMQELRAEARTIKDVEKRFVDVLSRSIEEPKSINRKLREIDPLTFSQDHDWREIIDGLNQVGDEYDAYRRVALVKYMQYLAARQDIIKHIYAEKKKYSGSNVTTDHDGELKDTIILEGAADSESSNYERMPKGEPVPVILADGTGLDIKLSRHKCQLRNHNHHFEFIDASGQPHPLKTGRNTVGRDADSTIVADPTWRDVSRLHLVIEIQGKQDLQLTDMSSHGTYLPGKFMDPTSS